MPELIWDDKGDRVFETGLDRGVLYLSDGTGVPWNGLISIVEKAKNSSRVVYYDGVKINDLISVGDYEAQLTAYTYPDEFLEFEGSLLSPAGVFFNDQPPKAFDLSYRTIIGDDVDGMAAGHKIHILYNVTAIPSDVDRSTNSTNVEPTEFEWNITAIPVDVDGYRPTAHVTIDSRRVDPVLLAELEGRLYGSSSHAAGIIPMDELVTYVNEYYRYQIFDNGDGTWTLYVPNSDDITLVVGGPDDGKFTIADANAVYISPETFVISDTLA